MIDILHFIFLLYFIGYYFYCRINSKNLSKDDIVKIGNGFLKAFYGFEGITKEDDQY